MVSCIGVVVFVVGLVVMILFGFIDVRLFDSYCFWNVVVYLVVLIVFIVGMIKVVDALLLVLEPEWGEVVAIE